LLCCNNSLGLDDQVLSNKLLLSRYKKEKFDNPGVFSPEFKEAIWESSQRNPFLKIIVEHFRDTLSPGHHWKKANVTLDPSTANPNLVLTEKQKSVRWGDTHQKLPSNPLRYDSWPCVLGCERFTSGRHYWEVEVEVGGDKHWIVGVARASVQRKGEISLSPEEGIWAIQQLRQDEYQATTSCATQLSMSSPPRRIRVYLDYAVGKVAFLNADTMIPIFTFPPAAFFGETIHPWFGVGKGTRLRLCP
uniref:B30.2/SPRY domain-containing protein n=1 Tax=Sphenodon punctatus TaxID=8508 RepID=A0A8D0HA71_SPHPU